jgi:SAM-dependent methyltransferase
MADLKEADLFQSLEEQRNHWYYFGKIRMLESIIIKSIKRTNIEKGYSGLDFGAGNGVIGRSLGPRLCGFNWQWDLIDSGYQEEGGDVNYMMYKTVPSGKLYDLILAIDVLEHVRDDVATLKMLRDQLKPGGILVICVPAFQSLWSDHDVFLEHFRRYSKSHLLECMFLAGLHPLKCRFFLFILFPVAVLQRLVKPRTGKPQSSLKVAPSWLNSCLRIILVFENFLSRFLPILSSLPGLSIVVVAESKSHVILD